MKKYNSVFHCFGFAFDHNKEDASDVSDKEMINSIQELIDNIREDGWRAWMEGPDNTIENE